VEVERALELPLAEIDLPGEGRDVDGPGLRAHNVDRRAHPPIGRSPTREPRNEHLVEQPQTLGRSRSIDEAGLELASESAPQIREREGLVAGLPAGEPEKRRRLPRLEADTQQIVGVFAFRDDRARHDADDVGARAAQVDEDVEAAVGEDAVRTAIGTRFERPVAGDHAPQSGAGQVLSIPNGSHDKQCSSGTMVERSMATPSDDEKMHTLDVGPIAHDMRNALATIMMNVTLLKRVAASGDAERIGRHVEVIGRAAEKLESLVTKLRTEPE
jgi:signal transduction histidine kinase